MGLYRGSMTYSRFFVRGEAESDPEAMLRAIRHHVFRPLDPAEEIDERGGWCCPDSPFDLELTYDKVASADHLNLGLRVDTWRIPRNLMKASLRDAERDYLGRTGEQKLTRNKKKELEMLLKGKLRRRVIPAMRTFELTWHRGDGVLRFFSRATKVQGLMVDLFEKTFGLDLALDGIFLGAEFASRGRHRGLTQAELQRVPRLEPLELT
ncbi:MAG: hypothetical protein AAGA56_28790 [Myxococcota bacterium]